MTILYIIVSMLILFGITLVAYLWRGPRFALGAAVVVFLALIILYFGLAMLATSQM